MERFQRAIATAAQARTGHCKRSARFTTPPGTYQAQRGTARAQDYLRFPGRPVVLWGPEWMGKTWLLERLVDQAGSKPGMRIIRPMLGLADGEARSSRFVSALAGWRVSAHLVAGRSGSSRPGMNPEHQPARLPSSWRVALSYRDRRAADVCPEIAQTGSGDRLSRMTFLACLGLGRGLALLSGRNSGLVLAISTAPQVLIGRCESRSPFNLSEPIEVGEFDEISKWRELAGLYGLRLTLRRGRWV